MYILMSDDVVVGLLWLRLLAVYRVEGNRLVILGSDTRPLCVLQARAATCSVRRNKLDIYLLYDILNHTFTLRRRTACCVLRVNRFEGVSDGQIIRPDEAQQMVPHLYTNDLKVVAFWRMLHFWLSQYSNKPIRGIGFVRINVACDNSITVWSWSLCH